MKRVAMLLVFLAAALFAAGPLEIRIIYDNTSAVPACEKDWGFAALVTMDKQGLLFDTGANADVFMRNLKALDIGAASIERVVISHRHADHTGGLESLRALQPALRVYMPDPKDPYEIAPGFYSTGTLPATVAPEQALAIETAKGLVVVTGCSHPGIVKIVETAEKQRGVSRVRFLIGGFHMLQQTPEQIQDTIASLKKLNVERISATHCTGELAIRMFRETFGDSFEPAGAGKRILLD